MEQTRSSTAVLADLYRPLQGHGSSKADLDGSVNAGGPGKLLAAETILLKHLLSIARERSHGDQALLVTPAGIDEPLAGRALRLMTKDYPEVIAVPAGYAAASKVLADHGSCLSIDLGATATVVALYRSADAVPASSKVVEGGGDLIDKTLLALLCRKCPNARIKASFARHLKESEGRISKAAGPIEAILPIGGKPTPVDVSVEMSAAVRSFLKPVFDAVGELVDAEVFGNGDESSCHRIVLSGGGAGIRELPSVLAEFVRRRIQAEAGEVSVVCASPFEGASNVLEAMRYSHWQQLAGLTAAGSAA